MEKVLVSGSAGFIGGYVVEELLNRGYAVVGLDNFSKYGKVRKSYDDNPPSMPASFATIPTTLGHSLRLSDRSAYAVPPMVQRVRSIEF